MTTGLSRSRIKHLLSEEALELVNKASRGGRKPKYDPKTISVLWRIYMGTIGLSLRSPSKQRHERYTGVLIK